jgi:Ca-activated chloride channel family protein
MRLPTAVFLTFAATAALAQNHPNTVLVMDGSGSMWGQVDGVAKITIAQEVVGNLLTDFPSEQGLGLTVYGHRERGECTDIETVVAPAPGTATRISDAVNAIKPLGKTPMTDAVIAAAEALRYTEEKATVILVSDGVETCNPDPCAAARLLEEAGIDFTAHVVGFDVGSDAKALAQMQCIADETGGRFLTADTADQLTEALTQVAAVAPEPDPEPALVLTNLTAVIEGTETLLDGPVLWSLTSNSGPVFDDRDGNPLDLELEEGSYTATAYSPLLEMGLDQQFVAIGDSASVQIAFPEPQDTARIVAPAEAVAGSTIQVGWDGPDEKDDYIGIGAADAENARMWQNRAYTSDGNPVELLVPPIEGPHLIRYFKREGREPLAETEIMVTPAEATLSMVDEAPAGSEITVEWTGPDYKDDYIDVGKVDVDGAAQWENWVYTREGSPATLTIPAEPGDYVVTYFMRQGRTPLASVALTATALTARIIAPTEAPVGSSIEVGWTGPDYDDDYIGIGRADAAGAKQWENWTYTRDGNPAELLMPSTPGEYLITYFQRQDRMPLASAPITLKPVEAGVTAPGEAIAGSTIKIEWTGPDYNDDYVGIGKTDAEGASRWENWVYTRTGSPTELTMPTEPGDYVITYFQRQDRTPLASVPIKLKPVAATLDARSEAPMGSSIEVTWTGPDYKDDYIGIGPVDASGAKRWENWTYTRGGSPAKLLLPATPGDYVIRYFVRQDRQAIAEIPITLTPVEANLIAPDSAAPGSTLEVGWTGPGYHDDYLGLGLADATGPRQWESWVYTRNGNPATITVPETPGEYVLQYFVRQNRSSIAQTSITVE